MNLRTVRAWLASLALVTAAGATGAGARAQDAGSPALNVNPFGVHIADHELDLVRGEIAVRGFGQVDPLARLRCGWVRINFSWWRTRAGQRSPTDFERAAEIEDLHQSGVRFFATIMPAYVLTDRTLNTSLYPRSDEDMQSFRAFLAALCARFGHAIDAYQLDNEIELRGIDMGDYGRAWKSFHASIREHDPDAQVLPSGIACLVDRYLEVVWPTIAESGCAPDALDLHYHPHAGQAVVLPMRIQALRQGVKATGPSTVWVTENSTWKGWYNDRFQSEEQQAIAIVKRCLLAAGTGSVSICGPLLDRRVWMGEELTKFSLNGLVYLPGKAYGRDEDPADPRDRPKLSYWALRLLIELSQGATPADFRFVTSTVTNLRPVGVAVRAGGGFYACWLDTPDDLPPPATTPFSLELKLHGKDVKTVRVVRAIPDLARVLSLPEQSYRDAFPVTSLPVVDGRVQLALDHVPLFVLPDTTPTAAPPKDSDSTAAAGD